ncbi:hypothetical protein B296_00007384 [Ensete ventricosum]|uniref:Uncharacterized protein n=1 Tax=Ensete ventricosum TaxID=4639 RepID=A0A427A9T8_ENSVE|nr:hypothetical protein B296_00007384 [Ensete ventricosum]
MLGSGGGHRLAACLGGLVGPKLRARPRRTPSSLTCLTKPTHNIALLTLVSSGAYQHVGGEREFCRCLSIHLRNGNAPHSHTQYLYSYDANPDGITATHTVGKASGVPCGAHPKNLASSDEKRKEIAEMFELFVLGCTGVVVFIHGANFFFRALSRRLTARPLRKASTLMPKHLIMSSALLYVKMASNEFFFLSAIAFPRRT